MKKRVLAVLMALCISSLNTMGAFAAAAENDMFAQAAEEESVMEEENVSETTGEPSPIEGQEYEVSEENALEENIPEAQLIDDGEEHPDSTEGNSAEIKENNSQETNTSSIENEGQNEFLDNEESALEPECQGSEVFQEATEEQTEEQSENEEQGAPIFNISISYTEGQFGDNLWINSRTFISEALKGYVDDGFYKNEAYSEYFEGPADLSVVKLTKNGLDKVESSYYDYIDLSKSHYIMADYCLKQGTTINPDSVITVNGQDAEWSCENDHLIISILILSGKEYTLGLSSESDFAVIAGCETEVAYYGREVKSIMSSDMSVMTAEEGYDGIVIKGMKPGKAVLTVEGGNGSIGQCTITVLSFMDASTVTLNSKGTKYVCLKEEIWEELVKEIDDYSIAVSNKNIATVKKSWDDGIAITGKYPGTTVITLKGPNGEISTIKVNVKPALKNTTKTPSVVYGSKKLSGNTTPGAKVVAKIGKKYYRATAAANGKYTINIPLVKVGTKIYLKYSSAGTSLSKTIVVKKGSHKVETIDWVYKNSTKVKGKVTNVNAGDYIRIKVNGKTYKKKITKAAKSYSFTIKISKPGKYGIRLTTELINKYNQQLGIEKEYVYKSDTVYIGDTKSTVRWLTYWNNPRKKNYYSNSEQWCYDWDGDGFNDAYLYFRNGKVSNWYVYE